MLLLETVHGLPEAQREVVLLRFYEGLPPREIAARLGVADPTVRSRLSRAVDELRDRLDARTPGGRERWLASLLPLIAPPVSLRSEAARLLSIKSVLACGLVVLSLVFGGWLLRGLGAGGVGTGPDLGRPDPAAPGASSAPVVIALAEPQEGAARAAVSSGALEAPVGPGPRLVVRATWSDGEPAVGASIRIAQNDEPTGTRHLFDEAVNDAGLAVFSTLKPGNARLTSDRGNLMMPVRVPAVGDATVDYVFEPGVQVSVTVVGPSGSPIAGAEVWLSSLSDHDGAAVLAGTCSDSGEFILRSCGPSSRVFAAAPGLAPSLAIFTNNMDGAGSGEATGTFVLREAAFQLRGQVLNPGGEPVVGAAVWINPWGSEPNTDPRWDAPPAMRITTDRSGEFQLRTGLPRFDVRVQVLAQGYPAFEARRSPPEDGTMTLDVRLEPGCRLRGVVRGPEGTVVEGAVIQLVKSPSPAWSGTQLAAPWTRTGADGKYELNALPAGPHEVQAAMRGERHFEAKVSVELRPSVEAEVDFELSPGRSIAGSVHDPSGEPLAGWRVEARSEDFFYSSPLRTARTNEQGEFSLNSLGLDSYSVEVFAVGDNFNVLAFARGQRVGRRGLQLVIDPEVSADAFVTGAPGEAVLEDGSTWGFFLNFPGSPRPLMAEIDAEVGTFRCGPVVPGMYVGELWAGGQLLRLFDSLVVEPGQVLELGEIEVPARASLTLNFAEKAPEKTHLQLEHENGRAIAKLQFDGASARATHLLPGRYDVRGEWPSMKMSAWQFTLSPGEDRVAEIGLIPSHTVAVRFEGTPDPARDHPLSLFDEADNLVADLKARLFTNSGTELGESTFLLNLSAGRYTVCPTGEPGTELGSLEVRGRVALDDPIVIVLPD